MTNQPLIFPALPIEHPTTADILANERKKATFDPKHLAEYLYGHEHLERQAKVNKLIEANPDAFDQKDVYFLSREQKVRKAIKEAARFVELMREHNLDYKSWTTCQQLIESSNPYRFNASMFIPCIENLGTEEQKAKYLRAARNFEIIGCFAQTELKHGSNVQGLETTATFIPESDEFEIHSPTLTAAKWWIGGLGVACTHAVVMARLVLPGGKDYGPHPFVVRIRDQTTHKWM
ncbi:acyl-CoA dehydrogenasea family protein, partial [Ramicandelaber brevisporus]